MSNSRCNIEIIMNQYGQKNRQKIMLMRKKNVVTGDKHAIIYSKTLCI